MSCSRLYRSLSLMTLFALGFLSPTQVCTQQVATSPTQSPRRWKLVWHDEFSGPANTPPAPRNWAYDLGNGGDNPGWGNHELERYTNSLENVFQDGDGHLVIRALRASDGQYTSGRIKTQHKFSFMYGKVVARIKIPSGTGIWPAVWMLGNSYLNVPWPDTGEIDIEENFGAAHDDQSTNHGSLHGPGYAGAGISGQYHSPDDGALADAFHIFSIEKMPGSVEFFVDGNSYLKVTRTDLPAHSRWVFDHPFFLLFNVAIGGSPAPVGYPDSDTPFPQDMLVDYVRVFQLRP